MSWVFFFVSLPLSLVAWGLGYLTVVLGIAHEARWEPNLVLSLELRPWFTKLWKYSTSMGRVIWYQPDRRDDDGIVDTRIERHEHVHVRQQDDMMTIALIISIWVLMASGDWLLALGIWMSGGAWILVHYVTAGLRYGWKDRAWYEESEHERSAYAQTDLCAKLGKSWQELREEEG